MSWGGGARPWSRACPPPPLLIFWLGATHHPFHRRRYAFTCPLPAVILKQTHSHSVEGVGVSMPSAVPPADITVMPSAVAISPLSTNSIHACAVQRSLAPVPAVCPLPSLLVSDGHIPPPCGAAGGWGDDGDRKFALGTGTGPSTGPSSGTVVRATPMPSCPRARAAHERSGVAGAGGILGSGHIRKVPY